MSGRLGSASPGLFIVVAFDGSGGKGGVGVGVTALKVSSVDELSREDVDESQVVEVECFISRMPVWYGDGVSGNQDAEDVDGAAAVMLCLRRGGGLLISDNFQTVMDILGIAQWKEMSAREEMRYRCMPSLRIIR